MPFRKVPLPPVPDMDGLEPSLDLAVLSVQSLDLRAQYEAKLRILTEIQREIELLRSSSATRAQRRKVLEQLARRFTELTAANREASDTLRMIRSEFERVQSGRKPLNQPAMT